LKKESLKKGIIQHYLLLARFTKNRLNDARNRDMLFSYPCWWCLKYFGKLEWVKKYSYSPWVKEVFSPHLSFLGCEEGKEERSCGKW